jgi:chemotaxis protein CheC
MVIRGDSLQVFKSVADQENLVLFLRIRFEISKKEIAGYVALMMDVPSIEQLRSLIADFISSVTQTDGPGPASLGSGN